jgi:hypothetical protein
MLSLVRSYICIGQKASLGASLPCFGAVVGFPCGGQEDGDLTLKDPFYREVLCSRVRAGSEARHEIAESKHNCFDCVEHSDRDRFFEWHVIAIGGNPGDETVRSPGRPEIRVHRDSVRYWLLCVRCAHEKAKGHC